MQVPNVPDSLSELDQWVLWSAEFVEGRNQAQKIPYSPRTRRRASTTNPRDWSSFSHCCSVWQREPWEYSGLGFVFSLDDPFAGIDLDDCLDGAGQPKTWAQPVLERFADTYMEISPSGKGIKIWAKASLEKAMVEAVSDGAIEMYDCGRYFCVTGQRWRGAPLQIEDHQSDVTELVQRLTAPRVAYETNGHHSGAGKWTINPDVNGSIPKGQRHDFLVSLAGTLHRRRLLPEIIETCLLQVNEKMCNPARPYTDDEIRKIVKDSLKWQ